jgi:hypothetical protein
MPTVLSRLQELADNTQLFGKGWHCPRQPEW